MRKFLMAWLPVAIILVSVGIGLNRFAVGANGGRMPVDTGFSASLAEGRPIDGRRIVMTSKANYPILGDCIPIGIGVISIGDVLILLGMVVPVVYLFRGRKDRAAHNR